MAGVKRSASNTTGQNDITAAKKSKVKGKQSVLSAEFVVSSDNDDSEDMETTTPNPKLALSDRKGLDSHQGSETNWTIQEKSSLGTKEIILDTVPSASNRTKTKAHHQARNLTQPTSTNASHGQVVVKANHEGKQSTVLEKLSPKEKRGYRSSNKGGTVGGSGRKLLLVEDYSEDPDDSIRGTRGLAEPVNIDQEASLRSEGLTALGDTFEEPEGGDRNWPALNKPESHTTKAIPVSSEDSSSECASSEASDDWSSPLQSPPQASPGVPPEEFQLPSGFTSTPVVLAKLFAGPNEGGTAEEEGLLSTRVFTSGKLPAHKQIWHISIPSSLPTTLINKFGKQEILQGDAGTIDGDVNYDLHVATASREHFLLPGLENSYWSLPCESLRTIHLQQAPRKANARQSIAETVTKRPKSNAERLSNGQQPEGLKTRYQPFGHLADGLEGIDSYSL